jgi:predicted nucleic acid-binding protein
MRKVFADAYYWVALLNPADKGHAAARAISETLRGIDVVTTDDVLTEVLAYFSERGEHPRQVAAAFVDNVLRDPDIGVHPHTHQSFLDGFVLFKARPDKGYSHTDCVSMLVMRAEGISDILSHDAHFSQEGFTLLL